MKEGWEYKKLGEVCDRVSNIRWQNIPSDVYYSYVDLTAVDRESFSITDTQSINCENAPSRAKQIIQQNDILFGTTRPTLRRVCIVENKNDGDICSTGFCVLRPKSKIVSPKWILYQLMAEKYYSYIKPLQSGATYPAVTDGVVKSYVIPVPPLSEQQHIVEELDLLSSIIEKKKAQLNELDNLAQSIFYEMFGDPINNEKRWEVKKLEDACTCITDGDHMPPPKVEEGIPFITISNIDKQSREIDFRETFFVPQDYYDNIKEERKAQIGDVLYTVTGSYGIPIIVSENRKFCFQRHIALLRPNKLLVSSCFLCYWALCKSIKYIADDVATGIAQKTVGLSSLRKFPVIIPPLDLQQQFASKIEAIEHQKELIKQSIKEVETQFNSRMDYYFN